MGRKTLFTEEQIEIIKQEPFIDSVTLGIRFGVSPNTVKNFRVRNGVKVRQFFKPDNSEFINVFNSCRTIQDVADYYNVSRSTIKKYASKLKLSKSKTIPQDKHQEILLDRENGISNNELLNKYNISNTSLYRILRRNNVKHKDKKKYTLNENYFKDINSVDKAYFLGFIAADGCVMKRKIGNYVFRITLSAKDEEILKIFCDCIETNKPIKRFNKKGFEYAQITITNNIFVENLINIGIKPRKTWSNTVIELPDEYMNHFIRGYFDGDGSITIYNKISISGFETNMIKFKNILEKNNIYSHFYTDKKRKYNETEETGSFGFLSFNNKTSKYSFLKYIYNNNSGYFLKRKYNKSLDYIKKIEESDRECDMQIVNYYNYAVQKVC